MRGMRRERGRTLWGRGGGRRMFLWVGWLVKGLGGLWFVGADVLGAVLSISSTSLDSHHMGWIVVLLVQWVAC